MVPKIIHFCWFSSDPFPVEIKACLETWPKVLPDYTIRRYTYDDVKSIPIPFLHEALEARKWAFATDVVRFWAVYHEGGVYMDSDIYLFKRFDEFIPDGDDAFVTFGERGFAHETSFGIQAAFFIATKGSSFCKAMLDHFKEQHFRNEDGSLNLFVAPMRMSQVAQRYGYVMEDTEQHCGCITVYPTRFLTPGKKPKRDKAAFAQHRIYHSWRKRKIGRRIEIALKHVLNVLMYKVRHINGGSKL